MPRLKLTVSYVGSAFHGWQTQAVKAGRRPRTVQDTLEDAFRHILGVPVHVHGAGRTDSGVHADAQCAHVDVPEGRPDFNWRRSLNCLLPADVAVLDAIPVDGLFHAQHSAVKKAYTYRLWLPREYVLPRWRPFVWQCGPLDRAAMLEAAAHLAGEHDFSAFRNRGGDVKSGVRTMHAAHPVEEPGIGQDLLWAWRFEANGFLKQMVRNLVGLLVAVGRGKLSPDAAKNALRARSRAQQPGPTAPACGLTLTKVYY